MPDHAAPIAFEHITDCHESVVSPLILTDRLISLAQDAERAGFPFMANRLVRLALRACTPPRRFKSH